MKLLKSIIISIVFWTTCLFANQTMVKDIATLSANSLYNLDDEQIVASLKPYMQQHKQIKAIKITDNTDGSTFMALFYKNKKIIHSNKFDEKKLSFLHQSANIIYDGEKIGIVDLYYIKTNQIVFTNKEQKFIKQQLPIKYVFDPKWKPFEFKNEINEHDGMIADLLQIIRSKSNLNLISVKTNSWKESKALVKSKQADMFSAISENEKRKKFLNFTKHSLLTYNAVFIGRSNNICSDFHKCHKKIAIKKGYVLTDFIKQNYPNLTIVEVPTTIEGFEKENVEKGGVVKDENIRLKAVNKVINFMHNHLPKQ